MIEDLNVVDLFCGCGGMSLGFKRQGFKVSAAFDNWAHAIDVYNKNLGDHAQLLDLGSAASVEKIAKIVPDIILGGPPCQDFSSARANEITGNRANLVTNYCNIVDAAQPSYFVFENVPRVRFSPLYLDMKLRLGSAGYRMSEMIINAKHYKVPQSRKRLILIGAKNAREGEFSEVVESLATKKEDALRNADIVTTDVWTSMSSNTKLKDRKKIFKEFFVSPDDMKKAKDKSIFLHCLPAHRGEEITVDMLEDQSSKVWVQAENRMHIQKAILEYLLLD